MGGGGQEASRRPGLVHARPKRATHIGMGRSSREGRKVAGRGRDGQVLGGRGESRRQEWRQRSARGAVPLRSWPCLGPRKPCPTLPALSGMLRAGASAAPRTPRGGAGPRPLPAPAARISVRAPAGSARRPCWVWRCLLGLPIRGTVAHRGSGTGLCQLAEEPGKLPMGPASSPGSVPGSPGLCTPAVRSVPLRGPTTCCVSRPLPALGLGFANCTS